jgi:hypothetical protein
MGPEMGMGAMGMGTEQAMAMGMDPAIATEMGMEPNSGPGMWDCHET